MRGCRMSHFVSYSALRHPVQSSFKAVNDIKNSMLQIINSLSFSTYFEPNCASEEKKDSGNMVPQNRSLQSVQMMCLRLKCAHSTF